MVLFPTCQVRVVRFYVSCLLLLSSPRLLLLLLNRRLLLAVQIPVGTAGPPLRAPDPCRNSTATIHAQCSLPDLNHDHPRPVFPAGPQPRPSPPSVPCRTSTGRGWSWLRSGREHWAGMVVVEVRQGTPRVSTPKDMPHRVPEDMPDRMLEDMPDRMPEGMPDRIPDRMSARMPEDMPDKVPDCQIECQQICQIICQKIC